MRETGEVIAADGGGVTVRIARTAACAHCGMCQISSNKKEMLVTARNDCAAAVGDRVRVELRSEAFLSAAFILYGLPFIGLMFGFAAGHYIGGLFASDAARDLLTFAAGIICAAGVYALIKKQEPRWKRKGYTPAATSVVRGDEKS